MNAVETLAVIGSRKFGDLSAVPYAMLKYAKQGGTVISGGARGIDRTAEVWATDRGLTVISYRPRGERGRYLVDKHVDGQNSGPVLKDGFPLSWPDFGSAAKARNWWIVRDSLGVLAFWDGTSTGTAHGIAAAVRFNRELTIWMEGDS